MGKDKNKQLCTHQQFHSCQKPTCAFHHKGKKNPFEKSVLISSLEPMSARTREWHHSFNSLSALQLNLPQMKQFWQSLLTKQKKRKRYIF